MKKTVLTSLTILCLLSTVFQMGFRISAKGSPELHIHNIDTELDYATIQEAINAPETLDGHTILVDEGIYYEHVVVNKSLFLIGEGMNTTIIDGNQTGTTFYVTANSVSISSFTIQNSGMSYPKAGIHLDGVNYCNITTSKMTKNYQGIRGHANYNVIYGNNITKNSFGIYLYGSSNNKILGNQLTANDWYGILLGYSLGNTISGNRITSNIVAGLSIEGSSSNTVARNNITTNECGIRLDMSSNNQFFHNNFVGNTQGVCNSTLGYANSWNDGYPSGGNYWDDYDGTDMYSGIYQNQTNFDGIGDTPYIIDDDNRDNYPLIDPYIPESQETLEAYQKLLGNYNKLLSDYNQLNSSYTALQDEFNTIRNLMYVFTATTIILIATTVYLVIKKPKTKR